MTRKRVVDIYAPISKTPGRFVNSVREFSPPGPDREEPGTFRVPLSGYALFVFFAAAISYFELAYRLWIFKNIDGDYIFSALFALPAAAVFFLVSVLASEIKNTIIAATITLALTAAYGAQLIYFSIFRTPLSLYSLIGAKDAAQFWDVAASAILNNGIVIALLFVPFVSLFLFRKKLFLSQRPKPLLLCAIVCIGIISYGVSILGVRATNGGDFSQYAVYYNIASPELSMRKLGVLTTMRLDLQRGIFGFEENGNWDIAGAPSAPSPVTQKAASPATHNMMNIDFGNLMSNEHDQNILDMHAYFSSSTPTKKNSYTGMFKGNNLIVMLAESFSPYAVSPELTPTLYKMSTEGFRFSNFYNPAWGVSTSDGEYVLNMGLMPKSGVWSMLKSSKNYLPFTYGNQFKKLGYDTRAFHNHTYTYYGRDKSIPNLGYDYKGLGNGLKVKKTWPESDLEMIDVTAGEYISTSTPRRPFETYYITMSGHLEYNFLGNHIAAKNKSFVDALPYSEAAKAYIAGNLELEFALASLLQKLEAAGLAENTVIAIVPDHYPYGLPKKSLDELAGHEVENNFELYKSIFILWKKGMESATIDEPVSTLDVLPTISNLFGLEYDSRLLMGRDVFSDTPPLVVFVNRSWITNKEKYNSTVSHDNAGENAAYESAMNKTVANKFKYSREILETDYYRKVFSR